MATKLKVAEEPISVTNARCHAFKHQFDGNVYQERHDNRNCWVARLQCVRCGTYRTDVMMPISCDLISRKYEHPSTYDKSMSFKDAKKLLFKWMMAGS